MYIEQLIGITSRAVCAGFGTPGKALAHATDRDAPGHGTHIQDLRRAPTYW